jgi:DNA replication protein DnaC
VVELRMDPLTGVGKTFLSCALADKACRDGFAARYYRLPRLCFELALARADGSYPKLLTQLAKTDLLILDDWGIAPLEGQAQHDLLEVIDDRSQAHSTLVASQVPAGAFCLERHGGLSSLDHEIP